MRTILRSQLIPLNVGDPLTLAGSGEAEPEVAGSFVSCEAKEGVSGVATITLMVEGRQQQLDCFVDDDDSQDH